MSASINTTNILNIIEDYCLKNDLSITAYAKLANVSKAWLSRLMNNPSKKISLKIAEQLLNVAGYHLVIQKESAIITKKRLKNGNKL